MKNPLKGLTTEEIDRIERNSYVIRIGNDMYAKDGQYVFSIAQAENHYETLLENILHTIENGSVKQRNAAMKCLAKLHIQPLRIQ